MSKNTGLQIGKSISGMASGLLPVAVLVVGGVVLYRSFINSGGLSKILENITGADHSGAVESKSGSLAIFEKIKEQLEVKKLSPSALHVSLSNSIFDLFNATSIGNLTVLGSYLNEEGCKAIWNIFNSVKWTADQALIYVCYNVRSPKARQSVWLGFLWDDTSGDLRQHVSRYISDYGNGKEYKTMMLTHIDRAVKAYL